MTFKNYVVDKYNVNWILFIWLWRAASKMLPMIPPPGIHVLMHSPPLSVAAPCDLLLVNRVGQKDGMSLASLGVLWLLACMLLLFVPSCLDGKSYHVESCCMEKSPWQGGEEDLQPTAKEELRSSAQPRRRN